ncbi:urea ABC transporter permease subunit UrtB [Paracoccaceae bacterium]|jgi:urea transport system permease protein|nr:urea ABC transporter permease subunit UrtB [Paracoccaceae bacterium]
MLEAFTSSLVLGLSIGSIFLIAAIGLAVVYGAAGVINMAHGELIMLGAYTTYMMQSFGVPFLICIPIAALVVAFIGLCIEFSLIRHLYDRPLDTLLATWGVSLVLMQGVRLTFGSMPQYIDVPEFLKINVEMGFVNLSAFRIFLIVFALILLFVTWYIFYKTRMGIQIRAVTQNKEMAASFGIYSSRVYAVTFAIGSGLAGVAGALFGAYNIVLPTMGMSYVVEAFMMVVSGGGGIMGTLLASVLAGEVQSIFAWMINDTFARGILYGLIVVLLRFRPQGLISSSTTRR